MNTMLWIYLAGIPLSLVLTGFLERFIVGDTAKKYGSLEDLRDFSVWGPVFLVSILWPIVTSLLIARGVMYMLICGAREFVYWLIMGGYAVGGYLSRPCAENPPDCSQSEQSSSAAQ